MYIERPLICPHFPKDTPNYTWEKEFLSEIYIISTNRNVDKIEVSQSIFFFFQCSPLFISNFDTPDEGNYSSIHLIKNSSLKSNQVSINNIKYNIFRTKDTADYWNKKLNSFCKIW